ncbi:hypothetical protein [Mycobacterium tilburgii]|uniref:hypothetical protein n=1 Tax=Mycobacterium tilburgii TaxID=44467 RepID=UPI001642C6A8|nr:hypothetical protein [Mycobacterium tilburgii]
MRARLSPLLSPLLIGLAITVLLAATFVLLPLLRLAARALVPSVLTVDLYQVVLF